MPSIIQHAPAAAACGASAGSDVSGSDGAGESTDEDSLRINARISSVESLSPIGAVAVECEFRNLNDQIALWIFWPKHLFLDAVRFFDHDVCL